MSPVEAAGRVESAGPAEDDRSTLESLLRRAGAADGGTELDGMLAVEGGGAPGGEASGAGSAGAD